MAKFKATVTVDFYVAADDETAAKERVQNLIDSGEFSEVEYSADSAEVLIELLPETLTDATAETPEQPKQAAA